jgi:hypothetical protein
MNKKVNFRRWRFLRNGSTSFSVLLQGEKLATFEGKPSILYGISKNNFYNKLNCKYIN